MELNDFLNELTKVYLVEQEHRAQKWRRGECFNVFNTLGLRTNEVRVHSAFVAELLNPCGSHGMDDVFLRAFLRTIGLEEDFVTECRGVIVERSIGQATETTGGRIDIILEDGKHAVIIENKIYAGDQENQILRYHNYAKENFPEGFVLIYLTLDGHEASDYSTGEDKEVNYQCISYGSEIIKWMTECMMQAFDKPLVRETIQQYITLLKELTGQDMSTENSNRIVDLAIQNLEGVTALMDSQSQISAKLRSDYVVAPLKDWATEQGLDFKRYSLGDSQGPALLFKKKDWNHYIAVTKDGKEKSWRKLYIGVSAHYSVQNIIKTLVELDCLQDDKPNEWWPYGTDWLPIGDWHSTEAYLPMKNGEVCDWIKDKVLEIIKEVEAKGLPI